MKNNELAAWIKDQIDSLDEDAPPSQILFVLQERAERELWVHSADDEEHARLVENVVRTVRQWLSIYLHKNGIEWS